MGDTMSDWIKSIREKGLGNIASQLDSSKLEDIARLRTSGLPQFAWYDTPLFRFTNKNRSLINFLAENEGVCIRAIPNSQGIKQGFTRHYKMGRLTFNECRNFLLENCFSPKTFWDVSLTEWVPNKYGFVLMSGMRNIIGEIGFGLDALSHGKEIPLARFVVDKSISGHIYDKTKLDSRMDKDAASWLWRSFQGICFPGGSFDPYCRRGYFEGVITRRDEIKFLDYKTNALYVPES